MGNVSTLNQYILTDKGLEIIKRFIGALKGEKVSSWSLTGPYGMGKSSFVNFFIALCGAKTSRHGQIARELLRASSENVYKDFTRSFPSELTKTHKGFFRIIATSSFEPVNRTIAQALLNSLHREFRDMAPSNSLRQLISQVEVFKDGDAKDTPTLARYIKEAGSLYGAPVVVVLDEFGKNLEYMAQHNGLGDVYILQTLAESPNIYLWVCLHQAFEEYSSEFSGKQLQEWGKIQGRFEDISFVEPQQQMIRFIAYTLKKANKVSPFAEKLQAWTNFYSEQFSALSLPGPLTLNRKTIEDCYPLHPLVVYVLPELCARFAQNDRTLFAFLCGGDPCALPYFLHHNDIQHDSESLTTFGLATLYDYFLSVTSTPSLNRPEAKRWFEVNSIIEETRHLPANEQELIKNIGLLNLLAKPTGLRASQDITKFALSFPGHQNIRAAADHDGLLDKLINKGLLIYREYADEYRLWEGTDIDIASTLEEYRERSSVLVLEDMLKKTAPLHPLIASRHSYRTGTLRYFERHWSSCANLEYLVTNISKEADGLVVYCFDGTSEEIQFVEATPDGRPVLIAHASCEKQLREAVIEATATNNMLAESPELARDGVARKEARYRAGVAEKRLKQLLETLFAPGAPVAWYAFGKKHTITTHRQLSGLLSILCDQVFKACPLIRNELINRDKLSSATAMARRELIDAMVTQSTVPLLNMQGTGPEVAIYRTMLLAEGLHKEDNGDTWKFTAPCQTSTFHAVWEKIDDGLKQAEKKRVPLSYIIQTLQQPPFGLKYGPVPVILCLYLLVNSEEVALYRENTFLPYLSPEEMELLVKRPDLFSVKRFATSGTLHEIFRLYQQLLNANVELGTDRIRNASMVSVVGPLIQFANNLSGYVLQTKTVSNRARNILRVLLNSKDPIELLFRELPKALSFEPFVSEGQCNSQVQELEFQKALRETLLELTRADKLLHEEIAKVMQSVFGREVPLSSLQEDLGERSALLVERCADKDLKPFLIVLGKQAPSPSEWVVTVATVVNQRPVNSWRDNDLQIFATRLHDLVDRFHSFESLVAAELDLPTKKKNEEIRYVSMMNSAGSSQRKILRVKKKTLGGMQSIARRLRESLSPDDLEALLLLLGDSVLQGEISAK
nr:hypothetical protein [uncultured Desulfobulbus sp.]